MYIVSKCQYIAVTEYNIHYIYIDVLEESNNSILK